MSQRTHTRYAREDSRIQAIRHVLSLLDYPNKSTDLQTPDPEKLFPWWSTE